MAELRARVRDPFASPISRGGGDFMRDDDLEIGIPIGSSYLAAAAPTGGTTYKASDLGMK